MTTAADPQALTAAQTAGAVPTGAGATSRPAAKPLALGIHRGAAVGAALLVGAATHFPSRPALDPSLVRSFAWLMAGLTSSLVGLGTLFVRLLQVGGNQARAHCKYTGYVALFVLALGLYFGANAVAWLWGRIEATGNPKSNDHLGLLFDRLTWSLLALCFIVWVCDEFILRDADLKSRDEALWLDFVILGAVIVTHTAALVYSASAPSPDYLRGFFAGAVAFEVIIANLLFDPSLMKKEFEKSKQNGGSWRSLLSKTFWQRLIGVVVLIAVLVAAPEWSKRARAHQELRVGRQSVSDSTGMRAVRGH